MTLENWNLAQSTVENLVNIITLVYVRYLTYLICHVRCFFLVTWSFNRATIWALYHTFCHIRVMYIHVILQQISHCSESWYISQSLHITIYHGKRIYDFLTVRLIALLVEKYEQMTVRWNHNVLLASCGRQIPHTLRPHKHSVKTSPWDIIVILSYGHGYLLYSISTMWWPSQCSHNIYHYYLLVLRSLACVYVSVRASTKFDICYNCRQKKSSNFISIAGGLLLRFAQCVYPLLWASHRTYPNVAHVPRSSIFWRYTGRVSSVCQMSQATYMRAWCKYPLQAMWYSLVWRENSDQVMNSEH